MEATNIMYNILISSAGRRVSLVKSFQNELKKVLPNAKVFASDMKPQYSAACQIADKYFQVPRITSEDFINKMLEICIENKIGIVIPTLDTELIIYSENKSKFLEFGINVIISEIDKILLCRDKRQTHIFFNKYKIKHAKEFNLQNAVFPIFAKPYDGSRSIDTYILYTNADISNKIMTNNKLMFVEYLNPKFHTEYTIDLYYDTKGNLKCIVPRKRLEVRDGEVSKGITKKNHIFEELKEKLNFIPGFRGCITLQMFNNEKTNETYGIEINARFGGGYPLSYLAGANFPKYIIQEYFFNKEIEEFDDWEQNLLMLRYDDEILVHGVPN